MQDQSREKHTVTQKWKIQNSGAKTLTSVAEFAYLKIFTDINFCVTWSVDKQF